MATLSVAIFVSVVFSFRALQWEIYLRVASLSFVISCCVLSVWYLHKGGSLTVGTALGLFGITTGTCITTYSNGGITSVSATWLLCIPILGGLMGGGRLAAIGFGFALVSGVSLLFLHNQHLQPPDMTPEVFQFSQNRMHQIGQLLAISVALFFYLKQVSTSQLQLFNLVNRLENEVAYRTHAEHQAEQASLAKGEFLANMSHEIRTPMNAIYASLQLLAQSKQDHHNQRMIDMGIQSTENLLTIINDILDFSKIEAGKLDLEIIHTDVFALMDSIIFDARPSSEAKHIKLLWHADKNVQQFVVADRTRLRQILINLVSNAIKFTQQGSVSVHIQQGPINQQRCQFIFNVCDTGIGMDEQASQFLFSRFSQADQSTTRKFGGTGLGLAISKSLAQMMGGDIQVQSKLGVGSIFTVTLSLALSKDSHAQATQVKNEIPDLSSIHILIAEDNIINQEVIKAILEPTNAQLALVDNGQAAIDNATGQPPDLILMDIQMPVLDGVQACIALRNLNHHYPIIALTANVMSDDIKKYKQAGFTDHISKPIALEVLYQQLNNYCLHK